MPAAVMACLYILSTQSPAANTPLIFVKVDPFSLTSIYPSLSKRIWFVKHAVEGTWPIATNAPSTFILFFDEFLVDDKFRPFKPLLSPIKSSTI